MMFYRKELDYDLNSLEPYIDTATMNEHYNVHYKTYTDKLNKELTLFNSKYGVHRSIEDILKNYESYNTTIRNNGGGYYNHSIYFENIAPIFNDYNKYAKDLGSYLTFEEIKSEFVKSGLSVFGSGWVWLIEYNGELRIVTTANQDNPIMEYNCKILLGMDVWEHAYYLKHKAQREAYINDFFQVINWNVVNRRFLGYL